jgi:hypothetical protein
MAALSCQKKEVIVSIDQAENAQIKLISKHRLPVCKQFTCLFNKGCGSIRLTAGLYGSLVAKGMKTMVTENRIYEEEISSNRTALLFIVLTVLFGLLCVWRVSAVRFDILAVISICLSLVFLFYVLNFRILMIQINTESLVLKFGIFTWVVPLDQIEDWRLDDIPLLMRYGGAGVHFMFIRKRYRASFDFLEYPRVVISLKQNVGPVQDISFTTRQPETVLRHLRAAIEAHQAVW